MRRFPVKDYVTCEGNVLPQQRIEIPGHFGGVARHTMPASYWDVIGRANPRKGGVAPRCRSCRARTSLTAGTIFEGTRKPLRLWFLAMWFVTSQKNGVSALGLKR